MQKSLSCFLIDNDEDDQEIFSIALREVDPECACIVADNGVAAIEKLAGDPSFVPSFIFVDMNMPLMNGKQCLTEIKKMKHLAGVPVYVYSTAADPYSIVDFKQIGAAGFIAKPSSFKELRNLLSHILQPEKISYEL